MQIIFCDLGTPSNDTGPDGQPVWTAYRQVKDQLVAGGIQAGQVKFIHDFPQAEPLSSMTNTNTPNDIRTMELLASLRLIRIAGP